MIELLLKNIRNSYLQNIRSFKILLTLFSESCEKISESINKTHEKLEELNKELKNVRRYDQQINILRNKKISGHTLSEAKLNKSFAKNEVKTLKDEVMRLAKETEELSKNEISKASKSLIKLKVDINDTSLAEKIYGEGKAIVIECFDHPKLLKALSAFSKGLEKVSPWIAVAVGGYEVYEAYEEGKDWKEEAFARGVQIGFTIFVGALAFAALPEWLGLIGLILVSIGLGYVMGKIGEMFYDWSKEFYKLMETGINESYKMDIKYHTNFHIAPGILQG